MKLPIRIELPADVWRSVEAALEDFLRFGPGEMDAEHVPGEHLEKALKVIHEQVGIPTDAKQDTNGGSSAARRTR